MRLVDEAVNGVVVVRDPVSQLFCRARQELIEWQPSGSRLSQERWLFGCVPLRTNCFGSMGASLALGILNVRAERHHESSYADV